MGIEREPIDAGSPGKANCLPKRVLSGQRAWVSSIALSLARHPRNSGISAAVEGHSDRQAQFRFTAPTLAAIFECQAAAMGLCNLATEDQTNSRTTLFGREKRHKEVRRVGDARAFIEHQNFEIRTVPGPS